VLHAFGIVRGRALAVSVSLALAPAIMSPSLLRGGLEPRLIKAAGARTPIQHVVFIFQENHSFDNVLGGSASPTIGATARPPERPMTTQPST
jgi:phospholipase C